MKIKKNPRFLETRNVTFYWPGDPSCDVASSDLVAWARSLGADGLVAKPGESLASVIVRRLTPSELPSVEDAFREKAKVGVVEAASIGLLRVGDTVIRKFRDGLIDRVPDSVVEELCYDKDWIREVPFFPFLRAIYLELGVEMESSEELDSLVEPTSIFSIAGSVILAHSFRFRRCSL